MSISIYAFTPGSLLCAIRLYEILHLADALSIRTNNNPPILDFTYQSHRPHNEITHDFVFRAGIMPCQRFQRPIAVNRRESLFIETILRLLLLRRLIDTPRRCIEPLAPLQVFLCGKVIAGAPPCPVSLVFTPPATVAGSPQTATPAIVNTTHKNIMIFTILIAPLSPATIAMAVKRFSDSETIPRPL